MRPNKQFIFHTLACVALIVLGVAVSGCVSDSATTDTAPPVALLSGQARLTRVVSLELSGYGVQPMRAGSKWQKVMTTDQGDVYRPVDMILTVTDGGYFSGKTFEADLVVNGGRIVGLYLPTEQKFVAATKPVSNSITEASR